MGRRNNGYLWCSAPTANPQTTISAWAHTNQTNRFWHESIKPTPKQEERLFHLNGYFKNGHATYGMIVGEPSYDEMRAMMVKIMQGELKPASSNHVPCFRSEGETSIQIRA
jgi:hypothetical protein